MRLESRTLPTRLQSQRRRSPCRKLRVLCCERSPSPAAHALPPHFPPKSPHREAEPHRLRRFWRQRTEHPAKRGQTGGADPYTSRTRARASPPRRCRCSARRWLPATRGSPSFPAFDRRRGRGRDDKERVLLSTLAERQSRAHGQTSQRRGERNRCGPLRRCPSGKTRAKGERPAAGGASTILCGLRPRFSVPRDLPGPHLIRASPL